MASRLVYRIGFGQTKETAYVKVVSAMVDEHDRVIWWTNPLPLIENSIANLYKQVERFSDCLVADMIDLDAVSSREMLDEAA